MVAHSKAKTEKKTCLILQKIKLNKLYLKGRIFARESTVFLSKLLSGAYLGYQTPGAKKMSFFRMA